MLPLRCPSLLPRCGSCHFQSYNLLIYTDGSVAFAFGKGGSGAFANCSLCGTEATLSFTADPVCSSFLAKAWAILQAIRWSRQQQKVCHFSSPSLRLTLCPLLRLSFYLKPSNRSGRNYLLSPPLLSGNNGSADTRFSRETTPLMSWPDGERYLCSWQSLVVSLLFAFIFSRIGGVLPKFLDTQVPSVSTEELVLPRHARCALSSLRYNRHSLLFNSYLTRIGRIESPSCSACSIRSGHLSSPSALYSCGFFVPLAFWRLHVSFRPLARPWGVARLLGSHGFPTSPSLGR